MTLAIYTHAKRRTRDDSADKIAELAGLSNVGNKRETRASVEAEEQALSDCSIGSPGWNLISRQGVDSEAVLGARPKAYPQTYSSGCCAVMG